MKDSDIVKNGSLFLVKAASGGGDAPFKIEYKFYTIVDTSAPPMPPKTVKISSRPPPPPKPQMTPVSAPDVPPETLNFVEGKKIAASIDPVRAAGLAQAADANWFAQQRYPQWFSVDLGEETTFDYVSIRVLAGLSLHTFGSAHQTTERRGRIWSKLITCGRTNNGMDSLRKQKLATFKPC